MPKGKRNKNPADRSKRKVAKMKEMWPKTVAQGRGSAFEAGKIYRVQNTGSGDKYFKATKAGNLVRTDNPK